MTGLVVFAVLAAASVGLFGYTAWRDRRQRGAEAPYAGGEPEPTAIERHIAKHKHWNRFDHGN